MQFAGIGAALRAGEAEEAERRGASRSVLFLPAVLFSMPFATVWFAGADSARKVQERYITHPRHRYSHDFILQRSQFVQRSAVFCNRVFSDSEPGRNEDRDGTSKEGTL